MQGRLDEDARQDLLTYLNTGEEGLAVEFLMDRLVLRRVPVTTTEVATLLELMRYFEMSPADSESIGFYPALGDPDRAAAELTVVDEPSS